VLQVNKKMLKNIFWTLYLYFPDNLRTCCWPLPAQTFSGPSALGLATIFYCHRFETSLIVAPYDSQGHGGGTQLASTRVTLPSWTLLHNHFARTSQETASIVKEAYLLIRCLAIDAKLRAFASAGICLPSCCLAMNVHVTILNRSVRAVKFWKLEADIRTVGLWGLWGTDVVMIVWETNTV
jgi:hypothetical protein